MKQFPNQLSKKYWLPMLMAILAAVLSVIFVHFSPQYESGIIDDSTFSTFKILSLHFTTFIIVAGLPYLAPAYLLSKDYYCSVHFTYIGFYGLFFYPVVVILSLGAAMIVDLILSCSRIHLEVLLFALTGGLMMLMMRAFLRIHYDFVTSYAIRWNTFWMGMISGSVFYAILIFFPPIDFLSYPLKEFIAYTVFLVAFNFVLIFSLTERNFHMINVILALCFIAFLFDVFANKRFELILGVDVPESELFW